MKQFKKALFLFHRDLRMSDNRGLSAALAQSEQVAAVFIIDPVQVSDKNRYRGSHSLYFMLESLKDLEAALHEKGGRLYLFHGSTPSIIDTLFKQHSFDAFFSNRDYTPFALKRDEKLKHIVQSHKAAWVITDDALLTDVDGIFTGKGTPYTIYSAFLKKAVQSEVISSKKTNAHNFLKGNLGDTCTLSVLKKEISSDSSTLLQTGGSQAGTRILHKLGNFNDYTATRDYPSLATTGLSAHLKFGTVSIRQTYEAIKEKKADLQLIKQLYWRDFFTYLGYHFPYVFGSSFVEKYQALEWANNPALFTRWCEGTTGFPLVDAGMRQLNSTGFMHNRVRMVVASFLTKDLHIDWQLGERYFAQQLTDYDPCVNNGNWQWSASTGADAQPYFRIFNPWLQQKKFDPSCAYIKHWIPELIDLPAKAIHGWYKARAPYKGYPIPVVDHSVESKKALSYFVKVARSK